MTENDFSSLMCGECGIKFYVPGHWLEMRRDNGDHGRRFYCPNGHCRVFKESELDRTRRERDILKQQAARLEEEKIEAERRAAAAKAAAEKLKSRTAAGVCPCCQRTVSQLARHMKAKHPDLVPIHQSSDVHHKINKRALA